MAPREDGLDGDPLAVETAIRTAALAATLALVYGLAVLPGMAGLRLTQSGGEALAATLGGVTLIIVALKIAALTAGVAAHFRPVHPVRLANVHRD
jgi:hypothetical protein